MQLCSCTPTTVLPATHRGLRVALRGLPHQNQHAKAVIRWQQRRVGGVVAAEPQNGAECCASLAALAEATHPWQQHSPPLPSQDDAPYVRHCSLCYIS
jgi:hypothetical protein